MGKIKAISPTVGAWVDRSGSIQVHLYGQEYDGLAVFVNRLASHVDKA